jgi:rare lipoprotein A
MSKGIPHLLPGLSVCLLVFAGCASSGATRSGSEVDPSLHGAAPLAVDQGEASYYGDEFEGRATASGEPFRQSELTAAHRTYPFGTILRVVNLQNGRQVMVRVNDRGPRKPARIVDLSRRAAEALEMIAAGRVKVRVEVLRWGG